MKPSIIITRKPLSFAELSPAEFERMCLWLVDRLGYLRPQHLGEAGRDDGCDVLAFKSTADGEDAWWFQCKRHQRISLAALKTEVDKLTAKSLPESPKGIVLVTSAVISRRTRESFTDYCKQRRLECVIWARTELDMLVKRFPELVAEFFFAGQNEPTALHQLPVPPLDFTGRTKELAQLATELDERHATIICLSGQAGVGKTTLAVKLAEGLKARYADAQFYFDLKGAGNEPAAVADIMAQVIRASHPGVKLPENEAELGALFRSVLHGRKVLLLMDNAADGWQIRPLIPPRGCLLLITSRQSFALPGMFTLRVKTLTPLESQELLVTIAPRISNHAESISRLCGYLPLALRASASLLSVSSDLDPGEYASRLTDEQLRIENLGVEGIEVSLEASFNLSYESLDARVANVFRLLSVFSGTFDASAEEVICSDSNHECLSRLVRRSLVLFDPESRRYRLHDLIRLQVSARLSASERVSGHRLHSEHYLKILKEADQLYSRGGEALERALAIFDREWDNIEAGHSWAAREIDSDELAAKLAIEYPRAGSLLLPLRQDPRQRTAWLELALQNRQQFKDPITEAFLMNSLGQAKLELRAYEESIELHERALVLALDAKDRHEENRSLLNVGTVYAHRGEGERGIELQEKAIAFFAEVGDHHNECDGLNRLGWSFADIGDYRRAIEVLERALSIARQIGDLREEGVALEELGWVYTKIDEMSRAIKLQEQGLTILKKLGASRDQGKALRYLGAAFNDSGEAQRAIEMHEQGLLIAQKTGNAYDEAVALDYLGWAHGAINHHDRAIDYHQRAAEIFKRLGQDDDESVALRSLADSYCNLEDPQSAVAACRMANSLARKEDNRFRVGSTFLRVGNVYLDQDDYLSAAECYQQTLRIGRELNNRTDEGNALYNLGICKSNLEDNRGAIAAFQESLTIYRTAGSREDLSDALQKLIDCYLEEKLYDDAIACTETLLAEISESEDREKELELVYSIGRLRYLKGDLSGGIDNLTDGLSKAQSLGNRIYVSKFNSALATLFFKNGQYNEAIEAAEKSLLGLDGSEVWSPSKSLFWIIGVAYEKSGDLNRAIEYLEKYLEWTTETNNLQGAAETLYNLGCYRWALNEDALTSIDLYERALVCFREIEHLRGEVSTLNNLGLVLSKQKDYGRAIEYLEEAKAICSRQEWTDLEQAVIGNLGDAFDGQGEKRRALEYYEKYLTTLRTMEHRPKEALLLNHVGKIYLDLYDYPRSIINFEAALQVSRQTSNRVEEAWALINIGRSRHLTGEMLVALQFYKEGLAVSRETEEKSIECDALWRVGAAYLDSGDFPLAITTLEESLSLARLSKLRNDEGIALDDLGSCYFCLGHLRKAKILFEESLSIFQEVGVELDEAIVLVNLSAIHEELGKVDEARDFGHKALSIARRINRRRIEAMALNALGVASRKAGELSEARRTIELAIEICRETGFVREESAALNNLGNIFRQLGDYKKAFELHRQALKIAGATLNPLIEAKILSSLGDDLRSMGQFTKSLAYYCRQLKRVRLIGARRHEACCLRNISEVLEALDRRAEAVGYADAAVKIYQEIETQ